MHVYSEVNSSSIGLAPKQRDIHLQSFISSVNILQQPSIISSCGKGAVGKFRITQRLYLQSWAVISVRVVCKDHNGNTGIDQNPVVSHNYSRPIELVVIW